MTNATTMPTADELRERIAAAETELADAERAVGAATLDGASTTPAAKRAQQAQAEIDAAQAALDELDRRESERRSVEQRLATARARAGEYRFIAEWLRLAQEMIAAHDTARDAIARLAAHRPSGRLARELAGLSVPWRLDMKVEPYEGRMTLIGGESGLDEEVIAAVRRRNVQAPKAEPYAPLGRGRAALTVERCRELRARAEELAADADAEAERLAGETA